MDQLRWSKDRVMMLDYVRLAENNKIRPDNNFLRAILTEVSYFVKFGY